MFNASQNTGSKLTYPVDQFFYGVNSNNTIAVDHLIDLICSQLGANDTGALPSSCPVVDTVTAPASGGQTSQSKDSFLTMLSVTKSNKIVLSVLFGLTLAAALIGNTLVMVTVMCNKLMWTTMHLFIVSLAVSDILVSLTCIPLDIGQALATEWIFGSLACQLMPFFMQVSITASTLTLCCTAAERYLAIVYPLKLNALQTTERALLMLLFVWLVAFAAGVPYAFFYDTRVLCGRRLPNGKCDEHHTLCSIREGKMSAAVNLHWLTFLILFLFPAAVLIITYGIIIYKLWIKAPVGVVLISATGMRTRYKRKAVKMLVLVVLLFLTCWAPLLIFDLFTMEDSIQPTPDLMDLRYYLQCLALSSTAYNPIVYAFMNQKFRTNFRALFGRNRNRVAPMATDREQQQQGGEANQLKTGSSNGGATTGFRTGSSPMQTRSTKL